MGNPSEGFFFTLTELEARFAAEEWENAEPIVMVEYATSNGKRHFSFTGPYASVPDAMHEANKIEEELRSDPDAYEFLNVTVVPLWSAEA